jgi:hypothetical protein
MSTFGKDFLSALGIPQMPDAWSSNAEIKGVSSVIVAIMNERYGSKQKCTQFAKDKMKRWFDNVDQKRMENEIEALRILLTNKFWSCCADATNKLYQTFLVAKFESGESLIKEARDRVGENDDHMFLARYGEVVDSGNEDTMKDHYKDLSDNHPEIKEELISSLKVKCSDTSDCLVRNLLRAGVDETALLYSTPTGDVVQDGFVFSAKSIKKASSHNFSVLYKKPDRQSCRVFDKTATVKPTKQVK